MRGRRYREGPKREWMVKFYIGGMVQVVMYWLQNVSYGEESIAELERQCVLLRQVFMGNCLRV